MPVLKMPREDATQLADAIENFYVDPAIPDGSVRRPSRVGRDPVEGERLYIDPRMPGLSHPRIAGGYYGPPLTDAGKPAQARLDYRVAEGPSALARRRPLPRTTA